MTYSTYGEAIRTMGRVVIDMGQIDPGRATVPESMIEEEPELDEWKDHLEGTEFWQTWTELNEIFETEFEEFDTQYGVQTSPDPDEEDYFCLSIDRRISVDGVVVVSLGGECTTNGMLTIVAEYRRPGTGSYDVFCEDILPVGEIDPVAIGRKVASIELAYLAEQTGSCAATLDYWQTHEKHGWYSQQEWASLRGVGRQTVNDRIRDATERLDE